MILLSVILPLLGFVSVALFGRFLGSKGSTFLTTLLVGFSFLGSCVAFYKVALLQNVYIFVLSPWVISGMFEVYWSFLFDTMTVVMLLVVTSVSFLVHFYSVEYMSSDPHIARFFSYLSLFTFFMLVLVSSDNLVQLFVGWEGVGLCSFLLINFWHTRYQANKSAIKAVIVNRIGDVAFCLAIVVVFYFMRTISFSEFLPLVSSVVLLPELSMLSFVGFNGLSMADLISFFIFIGAVGKSAQLGLHTWLPDAMEGPTPVSALIHAATMVTAGVFVLIRTSFVLEFSPFMLSIIAFVGSLTAFFAATVGVFQNDIKRVIAYSTCSQLGYMVFICGLSNFSVSMFHLVNHGFF